MYSLEEEEKEEGERVRSMGGGWGRGARLPHDESLLHHMASKWKRWASCLFSRSSAF